METKGIAKVKYIRMSPSKVSLVANSIRGKTYLQALKILKADKRIASNVLWKALYSAAANANFQHNIDKEELMVQEVFVNKGRPRAQGRIFQIKKRTSHLLIQVGVL